MVEHFLGKEEVVSSILINSSDYRVLKFLGKEEVVVLPITIGTSSTALLRAEVPMEVRGVANPGNW